MGTPSSSSLLRKERRYKTPSRERGARAQSSNRARLRVAFLGPEGTFTEEALFASIPPEGIEPVAEPTVYDCVAAVQGKRADRAIVPIENSLEGSVNATLDALVFETQEVHIVGEVVHPIRHCLIARKSLAFEQIERVVSHPQASAQCARFIRSRLPEATVVSANSTADAVKVVAQTEEPWAALGNRLAAELYHCEILQADVEDLPGNETRFVWLARERLTAQDKGRRSKTAVVFWGLPDTPGALASVLQEFAERDVNLTKIESRPAKERLGRYIFFADLDGDESEERIASALDAVRAKVDSLRILGSYAAA